MTARRSGRSPETTGAPAAVDRSEQACCPSKVRRQSNARRALVFRGSSVYRQRSAARPTRRAVSIGSDGAPFTRTSGRADAGRSRVNRSATWRASAGVTLRLPVHRHHLGLDESASARARTRPLATLPKSSLYEVLPFLAVPRRRRRRHRRLSSATPRRPVQPPVCAPARPLYTKPLSSSRARPFLRPAATALYPTSCPYIYAKLVNYFFSLLLLLFLAGQPTPGSYPRPSGRSPRGISHSIPSRARPVPFHAALGRPALNDATRPPNRSLRSYAHTRARGTLNAQRPAAGER